MAKKSNTPNQTPNTSFTTIRLPHGLKREISNFQALTGASRSAVLIEGAKLYMQQRMNESTQTAGAIK